MERIVFEKDVEITWKIEEADFNQNTSTRLKSCFQAAIDSLGLNLSFKLVDHQPHITICFRRVDEGMLAFYPPLSGDLV
jgi:hypothetical protein